MFKPYQYMDEEKLNEIGHQFQLEILSSIDKAATSHVNDSSSSLSEDNQIFLSRMQAFVTELNKWTKRDDSGSSEGTRMGMSQLDWLKIDLLYVSDL